MDWEFGVVKLLCIGWINNKVLLHSTGNCIQYLGINHNGNEYTTKCVYICTIESLCFTAKINIVNQLYFN